MQNRLDLHEALCELLGSRNVYFQPPESIKMSYPAIVYRRSDLPSNYANNSVYKVSHEYSVVVVDYNPDSPTVEKMSKFPTAKFERHYTANGLNHDSFSVFY